MKIFTRSFLFLIIIIAILSSFGCSNNSPDENLPSATGTHLLNTDAPLLQIQATYDNSFLGQTINTPTNDKLYIEKLQNVNIAVNGVFSPIEDAISNSLISLDEIICFARLDAAAGNCAERFTSKDGLATFYYRYPNFELVYINDVLETPVNGDQHITSMTLCVPGGTSTSNHSYLTDHPIHPALRVPLDFEDWGLTFTPQQIDTKSIQLSCINVGGQYIGQLEIKAFDLFSVSENAYITTSDPDIARIDLATAVSIPKGITTEFALDLSEFEQLKAGDYLLTLSVEDIYSSEQLHPLMRNFCDRQSYVVEFSIP